MANSFSSLSLAELARLCTGRQDPEAWAEFVARTHRLIASVVLRTARKWGRTSPSILDDLVQDTYLKLCSRGCRLLRNFQEHHADAIFGYLKVVTANVVHDHFKARHSQKRCRPEGGVDLPNLVGEERLRGSPQDIERQVVFEQIDVFLRRHLPPSESPRSRVIFWLYYRNGLTAKAIAALPEIGLSAKGVESTIYRLTRLLRIQLAPASPAGLKSAPAQKEFRVAQSF